jgi:biotin transport system substrate-specific component
MASTSTLPARTPLATLVGHNRAFEAMAILVGALLLVALTQVAVGWPIPMTLQTLGVLLLAGLGGLRVGAGAVALYVAMGAAGLPVFSNGGGGFAALFLKPSGFFLFGFVIAAAVMGAMFDRGAGRRLLSAAATLLLGGVIIYVVGVVGMLRFVGFDFGGGLVPFASIADVFAKGVAPFIAADLVKTAIALVVITGATAVAARR